jgi:RNA polymerase sigma-70 factor, ECF subfamily
VQVLSARDGDDVETIRALGVNPQPSRCYLLDVRSHSDAPAGVTDAGLLDQIAAGDQQALAELYRRHGQVVLAQINLVARDRAVSEEILQDTMLAVWRGAGSFRGDSSVRSWLIAIARRQTRDRLRRRRLRTVGDDALAGRPSPAPGPERVVLSRADVAAVAAAIPALAPLHREVLGLVLGAGLSLREAAAVLGIPVGTVKSRLTAARTALARQLDEKGSR